MPELKPIPQNRRFHDYTGMFIGRVEVIGYLGVRGNVSLWLCRCDCGAEIEVLGPSLRTGRHNGCKACPTREAACRHPLYDTWIAMIDRCHSPKCHAYSTYGGRGISVCERWRESFDHFCLDMGPRPPGHSIDRIDNNGNYEPSNCRWATAKEQGRNTRTNRLLEMKGQRLTLTEWAELIGIDRSTLWHRLRRGYSIERALTP